MSPWVAVSWTFQPKISKQDFFKRRLVTYNVFPAIVAIFSLNVDAFLSEFRDTSQKMQIYIIEHCRNCAKSCAQFPQIFEMIHFQK